MASGASVDTSAAAEEEEGGAGTRSIICNQRVWHAATAGSHSDLFLRTVSALVMVAAFMLVVLGGHVWVSIAVIAIKVGMFSEILGTGYATAVGGRIPLWRPAAGTSSPAASSSSTAHLCSPTLRARAEHLWHTPRRRAPCATTSSARLYDIKFYWIGFVYGSVCIEGVLNHSV
jgi:hypothetical protein